MKPEPPDSPPPPGAARSRRLLRLLAAVALLLVVYWANAATPPVLRLGILYLVPVLLVTFYDGLRWGIAFALASVVLREVVAFQQMPPETTLGIRFLNLTVYVVVLAVAMAGIRHMRGTHERLLSLATHDPLTSVLNARAFSAELTQELERNRRYNRPMALLYLDLDDFKVVNDTHGHQTGDAVLRLVADAIRRAVRQSDAVGRMGGDEFAVLMPETDGPVADAAAQRLAANLATVFDGTPKVTASIGLVSCAGTDAHTDAVIRRADQAMYEAKKSGKNRVVRAAI